MLRGSWRGHSREYAAGRSSSLGGSGCHTLGSIGTCTEAMLPPGCSQTMTQYGTGTGLFLPSARLLSEATCCLDSVFLRIALQSEALPTHPFLFIPLFTGFKPALPSNSSCHLLCSLPLYFSPVLLIPSWLSVR